VALRPAESIINCEPGKTAFRPRRIEPVNKLRISTAGLTLIAARRPFHSCRTSRIVTGLSHNQGHVTCSQSAGRSNRIKDNWSKVRRTPQRCGDRGHSRAIASVIFNPHANLLWSGIAESDSQRTSEQYRKNENPKHRFRFAGKLAQACDR
jgi:hypothetical protein